MGRHGLVMVYAHACSIIAISRNERAVSDNNTAEEWFVKAFFSKN
jgi:hypothetical protein